jgi:hypothetical protein
MSSVSVYDSCIIAAATSYESGALNFSFDRSPFKGGWEEILHGSHVRIIMGQKFSVVLGVQKLLGLGDRELGKKVIKNLSQMHNRSPVFDIFGDLDLDKSHTIELVDALVMWILTVAYAVFEQQMKRVESLGNMLNPDCDFASNSQCWRDVFGEPVVIDLEYRELGFTSDTQNRFCPRGLQTGPFATLHKSFAFADTLECRFSAAAGKGQIVTCELQELLLALGSQGFIVHNTVLLVQGTFGLAVRVGRIIDLDIPVWHVYSVDEAVVFTTDPESFTLAVLAVEKVQLGDELYEIRPIYSLDSMFDARSEALVVVGALVTPALCNQIDSSGPFVAAGRVKSGRSLPASSGLKWQSISGELGISLGASGQLGPQFGVRVAGQGAREMEWMHKQTEFLLAQSITTVERAQRNFLFVYQAATGQIVEQNLFAVVSAVVGAAANGVGFDTPNFSAGTTTTAEWWLQQGSLIRVCAALIASPSPLLENGNVGGIDLSLLVSTDEKRRVWEAPLPLPGWAKVLGRYPGVAVNQLVGSSPSTERCSMFITISGLERRLGRLVQIGDKCFEAVSGHSVRLNGVDANVVCVALKKAEAANKLRWVNDKGVYCPGERFGSQEPSQMVVNDSRNREVSGNNTRINGLLKWRFPWENKNTVQVHPCATVGLGQTVNGRDLQAEVIGMMVELS